jgi:hypothetical protein
MTMLFHTPSHLGDSSDNRRSHPLIWGVLIAAVVIAVAHLFA